MSIANEMSEHAFITQLIIQISERVRVTSPRLHSSQAVACLILVGNARILLFSEQHQNLCVTNAHQDLTNCSDEVQS